MLPTFEIEPVGTQQGSVIWMHGLGASNHDFEDLVPELKTPGLRYIFPAAPQRRVTINGGYPMPAWYDIVTRARTELREHEPNVRESAAAILQLVDREIARGVASERIVLCGFSQGGAMALHTALRCTQRLAGAVVLSGYLVLQDAFETERQAVNHDLPLLFCHGQFDEVVPLELGRSGYQRVASAGYPAEWREFPMAHSMCNAEVATLRDWLRTIFGR